jgi:hypothetical protein
VGPKDGLHAVEKSLSLSGIELRFNGRAAGRLDTILTRPILTTCLQLLEQKMEFK